MLFQRKSKQAGYLRYFVYLSDQKLQIFLEQIDEPVRRSIAAELRINLKLVNLTLTSPPVDRSLHERSRIAKLAVIEKYIKNHHHIGDLSSTQGYLEAEVMMDWRPCDDNETVLFCGYSEAVLVVLGGSISNLIGRQSSAIQVGSHPYSIKAAIRHGGKPGDLGVDLQAAAEEIYGMPVPVRFLAHVLSRGRLPQGSQPAEYLLATPLYIEMTAKSSV